MRAVIAIALVLLAVKPAITVYQCVSVDTTPHQWVQCIGGR